MIHNDYFGVSAGKFEIKQRRKLSLGISDIRHIHLKKSVRNTILIIIILVLTVIAAFIFYPHLEETNLGLVLLVLWLAAAFLLIGKPDYYLVVKTTDSRIFSVKIKRADKTRVIKDINSFIEYKFRQSMGNR